MLKRRSKVTLMDVIDEADAGELFSGPPGERMALNEEAFRQMVVIERKRTERSGNPFLLMLLTTGNQEDLSKARAALGNTLSALLKSTRQTDVIGWYKNHATIGVVFTGFSLEERNNILSTILAKVSNTLRDHLPPGQFNQLSVSFHFFPDDWDHDAPGAKQSRPVSGFAKS